MKETSTTTGYLFDRLNALHPGLQVYDRLCMYYILTALQKYGPMKNKELLEAITQYKAKTINENLKKMTEWGMIERIVSNGRPIRVEYRLLPPGEGGLKIIEKAIEWSETYGAELYQRVHDRPLSEDNHQGEVGLHGIRGVL